MFGGVPKLAAPGGGASGNAADCGLSTADFFVFGDQVQSCLRSCVATSPPRAYARGFARGIRHNINDRWSRRRLKRNSWQPCAPPMLRQATSPGRNCLEKRAYSSMLATHADSARAAREAMTNDHRNPRRDYLFLYPRCSICSFLAVRFRLCILWPAISGISVPAGRVSGAGLWALFFNFRFGGPQIGSSGDRDRFAQLPSGIGRVRGQCRRLRSCDFAKSRARHIVLLIYSTGEHHDHGDKGQDRRHRSSRQSQGKPGPESANAA
jgi:hypothetical protein